MLKECWRIALSPNIASPIMRTQMVGRRCAALLLEYEVEASVASTIHVG